jgi:hypothetical protein
MAGKNISARKKVHKGTWRWLRADVGGRNGPNPLRDALTKSARSSAQVLFKTLERKHAMQYPQFHWNSNKRIL